MRTPLLLDLLEARISDPSNTERGRREQPAEIRAMRTRFKFRKEHPDAPEGIEAGRPDDYQRWKVEIPKYARILAHKPESLRAWKAKLAHERATKGHDHPDVQETQHQIDMREDPVNYAKSLRDRIHAHVDKQPNKPGGKHRLAPRKWVRRYSETVRRAHPDVANAADWHHRYNSDENEDDLVQSADGVGHNAAYFIPPPHMPYREPGDSDVFTLGARWSRHSPAHDFYSSRIRAPVALNVHQRHSARAQHAAANMMNLHHPTLNKRVVAHEPHPEGEPKAVKQGVIFSTEGTPSQDYLDQQARAHELVRLHKRTVKGQLTSKDRRDIHTKHELAKFRGPGKLAY